MQGSFLLLGGRSLVAPYLLKRLTPVAAELAVASRQTLRDLPDGVLPLHLDIAEPKGWHAPSGETVISLLPLWVLAEHIGLFDHVSALIAVSSTSRFGKATSDDPLELETVRKLTQAEETLESWAREKKVALTILRPTLIYDGQNDVNVTRLAATIRRLGFFPLAAPGKGLRQPIHADDVAAAIMGTIGNPAAAHKAFNIAGGEVLTYKEMVARVFRALGLRPRFLVLPVWLLKTAFRLARALGLLRERHFGFAVFQRMNENLVFEVQDGLTALGYKPRPFRPVLRH